MLLQRLDQFRGKIELYLNVSFIPFPLKSAAYERRRVRCSRASGVDVGGRGSGRGGVGRGTELRPERDVAFSQPASPLRVSQKAERRYSVSGTPGDCVVMAVRHLMVSGTPDLVLSGINRGANLGIETVLSGTVGAAMTGMFLGIPSMALSQAFSDRNAVRWDTARAVRDGRTSAGPAETNGCARKLKKLMPAINQNPGAYSGSTNIEPLTDDQIEIMERVRSRLAAQGLLMTNSKDLGERKSAKKM